MGKSLAILLFLVSAMLQGATVEIAAPTADAVIGGSEVEIKVAFASTADKPITNVKVYLDGALITELPWQGAEPKGECSFTWDTTRTPNGPHKVDVQVFSKDEYLAMASLNVSVLNKIPDLIPPLVGIASPKEGEALSGTITIIIEATDDGPTEPFVSIYIDGALKAVKNHGPYMYDWDTTAGEDRSYTIQAVAVDAAGNKTNSKPVKPIVRNPRKQVPITERDYRP